MVTSDSPSVSNSNVSKGNADSPLCSLGWLCDNLMDFLYTPKVSLHAATILDSESLK